MELTRRDAVAALAVSGIGSIATLGASELHSEAADDQGPFTNGDLRTLVAVAEVVYPSVVDATPEFVETYMQGLDDRNKTAVSASVGELNRFSRRRRGTPFYKVASVSDRDSLLRTLGVDRVEPVPDGTVPERLRYHVVNELLYALFTNPKGSLLFGIENPVGYPGGFAPYREGT